MLRGARSGCAEIAGTLSFMIIHAATRRRVRQMDSEVEERIARLERITRLLALKETVRTKSVRNSIRADLNKELLAYIKR